MSNREKTIAYILKYIKKITNSEENVSIYKNLFSNMTDDDFSKYIDDLESERKFLTIISPNFGKSKLSVENNLAIAEELGHDFFERLWIEANNGSPTYLTPIKYIVVDLPLRRASQLLIKKIRVPNDNRVIDSLTGQPTGDSKGAKITYPELQVCAAMGLDATMIELMKYRGGDNKGIAALNGMINKYGNANLSTLKQYSSGVESTKTLKTFLTAMHLRNTL